MKIDTNLAVTDLTQVVDAAKRAEAIGFDGLWSIEAQHEAFLPLAAAVPATTRLSLGTAIALAFPRSPMVLAYTAWDLAASSKGRFILGLGTQVKGHNERRFSVKWEAPAKRFREVILSLRAIWGAWQDGTKLDFRGEHYQFTLMTPFFSPGPIEHPKVPIWVAGVNPQVIRLAGELADGFHVHPLHSPKFLRERLIPDIEAGGAKSGRTRKDLVLSSNVFAIVGDSRKEIEENREKVREQISFYASTRTYMPVLETHGWQDVCLRLNEKAAKGDWAGMKKEISDEILEAFAVEGSTAEIAGKVKARYEGLLDRVTFYFPDPPGVNEERWRTIVAGFRG